MNGPDEVWRMRKQFALQIASSSFMTYTFCLSSRQPSRFQISRKTGFIAMTELLPSNTYSSFDSVPYSPKLNSIRPLSGSSSTSNIHLKRCCSIPPYSKHAAAFRASLHRGNACPRNHGNWQGTDGTRSESKFVTVGVPAEVEILFSSISNSSFAYLAEKKLLLGYKCVDALQWWTPSSGLASHNTQNK